MISAYTFKKIQETITRAEAVVKQEAPKASFVFEAVDGLGEYVYFKVVCKNGMITPQQIRDLKEKTNFEPGLEDISFIYSGSYRVRVS